MDSRHLKPVKQASKVGSWRKCLQQLLTENRREEEPDVQPDAEEQESPSPPPGSYSALLLERLTRKKSFSGSSRCSARNSLDVSPRPRNCTSLDISPRTASCNELASPTGAIFPALHHRASVGSVASTRPSSVVATAVFRGREGNEGLMSSCGSTPRERLGDAGSSVGTPRASRWGRQRTTAEASKPRRKSLEILSSIDSAAEMASHLLARDHDAPNHENRPFQASESSSTQGGQGSPPAAPLQPRPSSLRPPGGMAGRTLASTGTDAGGHDSTQAFANAFLNAAPMQRAAAAFNSRAGPRPPALPPKSPAAPTPGPGMDGQAEWNPTSNGQASPARPPVPPLALPGKLPPIHLHSSIHSSGGSVHSSGSNSVSARSSSTPRLRGTRLQGSPAPLMPVLDLSGLCTPRQERGAEGGGEGEGLQKQGEAVGGGGGRGSIGGGPSLGDQISWRPSFGSGRKGPCPGSYSGPDQVPWRSSFGGE